MLERTKADQNPSSFLLAFKPRQLLLAEQKSKAAAAKMGETKKVKKITALIPEQKSILIQSVLQFLERSGFHKARKRLLSEAQIEGDKWKTISLDLEEIYRVYLETCCEKALIANTMKDEDLKTADVNEKDSIAKETASEKQKRSGFGDDNDGESHGKSEGKKTSKKKSDSLLMKESSKALKESIDATVSESDHKELKRKNEVKGTKKQMLISEELDGHPEQEKVVLQSEDEFIKEDLKKNDKVPSQSLDSGDIDEKKFSESHIDGSIAKKRKNKTRSDRPKKAKQCGTEEGMNGVVNFEANAYASIQNANSILFEENKSESKKKKKKKGQISDETRQNELLDSEYTSKLDTLQTSEGMMDNDRKDSKKRKRIPSEEIKNELVKEVTNEEKKRRKVEGRHKSNDEKLDLPLVGGLNNRSVEHGRVTGPEDSLKHEDYSNGILDNSNGVEPLQISTKKQLNRSTEPTSAKAFQRVKVDEVEFADTRLQNNSYWAKDGSEIGYGAKAQEVLGQVRGRDFRHEKTKKKRGSYRGGMIDLQSHSVKFTYSDDE